MRCIEFFFISVGSKYYVKRVWILRVRALHLAVLRKCSSESQFLCPISISVVVIFFIYIYYAFVNSLKSSFLLLWQLVYRYQRTGLQVPNCHCVKSLHWYIGQAPINLWHIAFEELVFTVILLERYDNLFRRSKFGTFWVLGAMLWIRIQSGLWIRIRIRNPDPDPRGQKWPTKVEKNW